MQLLFAHDHRFARTPDGEHFTSGSLPARVWERYLRHFEEVAVLARIEDVAEVTKLAPSSHPAVRFISGPDLNSARSLVRPSAEAWATVERAVSAADAVVARVPSALGQAAITAARTLGKPYAVEVVGCPWDTYANHGSFAGRLYAPLATARMKRAVRSAPLALYVTERWLQGRYPARGLSSSASNVELIPPDDAAFESRRLRLEELRKGRPPKLGSVASLRVKYKGVQTAIAALARLRREGLSLPYAVLGPGDPEPWRGMARNFGVEDLVSFDGTRPAGPGVRGWLDEIDIHLQPSFQEGLPRSTIEAMSRGAACVGSTCGGIPELLPAERTHRPGDVQGLARIIARLGTDSAEIAEASRIGFERARAYYPDVLLERRDVVIGALRALAEQQAGRSERIAG